MVGEEKGTYSTSKGAGAPPPSPELVSLERNWWLPDYICILSCP